MQGAARLLLCLAVFGSGCSCEEELTDAQKREGAAETVRRFYTGLEQQSCEVIAPLLVKDHGEADCHEMVQDLNERGVSLVDVVDVSVDGRNPNAVIVKVRIRDRGSESEMLMRVEREEDAWKLRM